MVSRQKASIFTVINSHSPDMYSMPNPLPLYGLTESSQPPCEMGIIFNPVF